MKEAFVHTSIKVGDGGPLDSRHNRFSSTAEAIATITIENRYLGLPITVAVDGLTTEYWWKDLLTDEGLILKVSGGDTTGLATEEYVNEQDAAINLLISNLKAGSTETIASLKAAIDAAVGVNTTQTGQISAITSLLNSDNSLLDTIQEIVDYIEQNRESLDAVLVNKLNTSVYNAFITQNAIDLAAKENKNEKDASGGYAGLTLFKINFRNALNTITSFFTNANTVARTYTFPDKDGTVAMVDDIPTAVDISGKQNTSEKDASGGYAGLTLFKINFKNALNTITSFFTNANTVARTYTFPDKDGTVAMLSDIPAAVDISGKQNTSEKDASGGYAGLTLFKINFKNALNTFTSFFTNANTAARTYTFPDKNGTVAMLSDIPAAVDISGKQNTSEKDASGGYAGLTLFKINFKNALNTFTSFFTNANTVARTYTFPDKDGTVAMLSDITAFTPITENQAGTVHPAFTNQNTLNIWLLANGKGGAFDPQPAAPTSGVVNDTTNTFTFTPTLY